MATVQSVANLQQRIAAVMPQIRQDLATAGITPQIGPHSGRTTAYQYGQLVKAELQRRGFTIPDGYDISQQGQLEKQPGFWKTWGLPLIETLGAGLGPAATPGLTAALAPTLGATAAKIAAPALISTGLSAAEGRAPTLAGLATSLAPAAVPQVQGALTPVLGPTGAKIAAPVLTSMAANAARGQAPTLATTLPALATSAARTLIPTPPTQTPGIASLTGGPGGDGNPLGLSPADVGRFGAPSTLDVTPPTTTTDVFQTLFAPRASTSAVDQSQFQMPGVTPDVAPPPTLGGTFTPPTSLGTPFGATTDTSAGAPGTSLDQVTPLQWQGPMPPTGGAAVPWYTQLLNALTGKGGQGQSLLNTAISGALQYAAASKTAGAQTQAAQTAARTSLLGAQLAAQTAANAQALQAALAQGDVATANAIQQGNYGQWKAREQRLSNFGQLLGLPARQIPDYVPIPPLNLPNLPAPSLANLTVPNNLTSLLGGG
jgi:hypothetical protein